MLQECCESQPARPPRRAVFAAFCSGAREIFHEGVGPRFVCISSLFAAYCVRAVFACFCKYAADRTFVQLVLADLGTGAYALADTSTEALRRRTGSYLGTRRPIRRPRRNCRCAEIVTYLHLPCASSCHPVDKWQRPPHSKIRRRRCCQWSSPRGAVPTSVARSRASSCCSPRSVNAA